MSTTNFVPKQDGGETLGTENKEFSKIYAKDIGGSLENILAKKDSPKLTGMPTAPTAEKGTRSEQIATTEFVMNELDSYTPSSGENNSSINYFKFNPETNTVTFKDPEEFTLNDFNTDEETVKRIVEKFCEKYSVSLWKFDEDGKLTPKSIEELTVKETNVEKETLEKIINSQVDEIKSYVDNASYLPLNGGIMTGAISYDNGGEIKDNAEETIVSSENENGSSICLRKSVHSTNPNSFCLKAGASDTSQMCLESQTSTGKLLWNNREIATYTAGETDLQPGVSDLPSGVLYFVYE